VDEDFVNMEIRFSERSIIQFEAILESAVDRIQEVEMRIRIMLARKDIRRLLARRMEAFGY
jgi:hypothetical protein